jgi:hypothetical protein
MILQGLPDLSHQCQPEYRLRCTHDGFRNNVAARPAMICYRLESFVQASLEKKQRRVTEAVLNCLILTS